MSGGRTKGTGEISMQVCERLCPSLRTCQISGQWLRVGKFKKKKFVLLVHFGFCLNVELLYSFQRAPVT